ncbi:MAG: TetR/AcrR family transcriptional regulator [Hyphomicrobiales bacterium]
MTEPEQIKPEPPEHKGRYHHGDLREALIAATQQLVVERGAENFSLADACRCAGCSTAAPYRHFRDKQEILEEITARGFQTLDAQSMKAVEVHGSGTLEGITAMGRAYVNFALNEQALFRLMFGQNPSLKATKSVETRGHACFDNVIGQVAHYCEKNGIKGDARELAVQLWTFVHGAASLLIDQDYEKVAPDIDIEQMIVTATRKLLSLG